mgnify:CR=1 FL=1
MPSEDRPETMTTDELRGTARSAADGTFRIVGLEAGKYTVEVEDLDGSTVIDESDKAKVTKVELAPGAHDSPRLSPPLPRELRPDERQRLLASAPPQTPGPLASTLAGSAAAGGVAVRGPRGDADGGTRRGQGASTRALAVPGRPARAVARR